MQIGPKTLARALEVRNHIDSLVSEVRMRDNQPDVDADSRAGEVVVSSDQMYSKGLQPIQVRLSGSWAQLEEVKNAYLSFDPATQQTKGASLDTAQFYNSSYGRSAQDLLQYKVSHESQGGRQVNVYERTCNVVYNDHNTREIVRVDAASGDILSYKGKEYASTFPGALKEVFTSGAGIGLVLAAGALCGVPGSLGYALAGPAGGLVGAGAAALALAYAKTRPSAHSLPKGNE